MAAKTSQPGAMRETSHNLQRYNEGISMPLFDFECEDCGKHFEELLLHYGEDLIC